MDAPFLAQADTDIDVNPVERVMASVEDGVAAFLEILPGLVLAVVVLAVFWGVARLVRSRSESRLASLRTPSFGRVFSSLLYASLILLGLVVALPIAFPSLSVATMLGGLGLLGVAAGFAFQDILSNLLAGILLIFRQPFVTGDQIEVDGLQGTVEGITIRETRLRTFGGRLVVIPNMDVYTNALEVQTNRDAVRTSFVTGVAYGTDLAAARQLALETLAGVDGVLDDPAPQAYYTEHAASSVALDLRYWTGSRQAEIRRVQDLVTEAIHDAFDAAGIDIPFDMVTLDTAPSFDRAIARAGRGANGQARGGGAASSAGNGADLGSMTRSELYELAQELDIEGRSQMSKAELADAIRSDS